MREVRKLQKKLRQIENLELKVSLTPDERVKIYRKAELRARLAELLPQLSGPQQTRGILGDETEKMKRRAGDVTEVRPLQGPAAKIKKAPQIPLAPAQPTRDETAGTTNQNTSSTGEESSDLPAVTQSNSTNSEEGPWEKIKFCLRPLEGHSDIITCVVAVENLVISGSRDTTVKVWHVPTATEQRNLGGHSGGVTCLSTPPPDYCRRLARSLDLSEKERFVLSGSADCCVRIWALTTGQCVKSIYTFNGISALCFVPEGIGYIITGSDGGKVQAWSWESMDNCQSLNAHEEVVTTLQCQGPLAFSGSADGGVSVWEVHCSDPEPLHLLRHWGTDVTGCKGQGGAHTGRLTLSPRGDQVFLAYGRACLKILNWRTGRVTTLTNHSSIAGVTDCVHQIGGVLIGSCFDLATGESALNLFSLPQCRYLVSLTVAESPRILCFAAWLTGSGGHRWVTGGRELTVWEQLPGKAKQRGDVIAKRDSRLDGSLIDSEDDSEDGVDSDDYEEDYISQDASSGEQRSSWFRCVLQ